DAEAGEFVVAVALADAEIEPPAGEEIERRRLFGEQHRVVPREHQHSSAQAQGRGAGTEPGQQVKAGGDLAKPGEVVLDDKGRMKAERLGLDVVLDPVAKALAAVGQFGAGRRAARLGAAKKSKTHWQFSVAAPHPVPLPVNGAREPTPMVVRLTLSPPAPPPGARGGGRRS